MPSMVVFLLSAAIVHAPAHEAIVLWNDPCAASFEQTVVRHMLMQTLAADASGHVYSNVPLAPRETRAIALRRRAGRHLVRARTLMDALSPDAALVEASKARQKLQRVALLTGDPLPLCDALALVAESLLLLGDPTAATRALEELLVLAPDWQPPGALFNPAMQARVDTVRRRLQHAPQRTLSLAATRAGSALFVDGHFVGFDTATVQVPTTAPHLLWALAPDGQHTATRVAPDPSRTAMSVTLVVDRPGAPASMPAARVAQALEASRSRSLQLKLDSPALYAMRVGRVLVLAYGEGELVLTHLQMHPAQRRRVRSPAIITSLRDAQAVALQLLAEPPELVPLPGAPQPRAAAL